MGFTIADKYYIKAMDEYPYCLEEALENLNYALSSDPEHAGANYLMARFSKEQLSDFEKAEHYFQIALTNDPTNSKIFLEYTLFAIESREFDKAIKLIEYCKKLQITDLALFYSHQALLYEYMHKFKKAIKYYKKASMETFGDDSMQYEAKIKRVKSKIKLQDKPDKKKKRVGSKKKK